MLNIVHTSPLLCNIVLGIYLTKAGSFYKYYLSASGFITQSLKFIGYS